MQSSWTQTYVDNLDLNAQVDQIDEYILAWMLGVHKIDMCTYVHASNWYTIS